MKTFVNNLMPNSCIAKVILCCPLSDILRKLFRLLRGERLYQTWTWVGLDWAQLKIDVF